MRFRQPENLSLFQLSMLGTLIATNALVLSAILLNTDIVQVWQNQTGTFSAYEARIAELSNSVDNLRFRELSSLRGIPLKMQELNDRQSLVGEQLDIVLKLAKSAALSGTSGSEISEDRVAMAASTHSSGPKDIDTLAGDLEQISFETADAVAELSVAADRSTNTIVEELSGLGLTNDIASLASGGPLMPATNTPPQNTGFDVQDAVAALERLAQARRAMDVVPIHQPLRSAKISSGFGGRTDPFTGRSAFHSGIDFPAPTGTPVQSAGGGTVTFVGWKGDYGYLVEVTHSSGLVSRYPHLSKILVELGDEVEADVAIALVGSTGRSTGSHLHFELRDATGAIDPTPYLAAGKRLKKFES